MQATESEKALTKMEKKRILYISQEIRPYLPESPISKPSLELPKKMNEAGHEVRVFMPRFGVINERRHQLHEVIRLSGMNIVINDMDQPLIIKVASVPQARMQVYFIDNEEYFKRKSTLLNDKKQLHKDNDERALFFSKSVIETVRKLGWKPDIIHVHGWMCSAVPMYLREFNSDDPHFADAKIVYSLYNKTFDGELGPNLAAGMKFDGVKDTTHFNEPNFDNLHKGAMEYCDAVVKGHPEVPESLISFAEEKGLPIFDASEEIDKAAFKSFYENVVLEDVTA